MRNSRRLDSGKFDAVPVRENAHLNRREFLGAGGIALAGTLLASPRVWAEPRRPTVWSREADVLVLGAGLSGLVAARELRRLGVGNVLVLEARQRVGGRVLRMPIPGGGFVEAGGQWTGPKQTAILKLAEELGVPTHPVYDTGRGIVRVDDRNVPYDPSEPDPGLLAAQQALDPLLAKVAVEKPWAAPDAAAWDARTVRDWVNGEGIEGPAATSIESACNSLLGGSAAGISLLWFLYYVKSAGGLVTMMTTQGGAQDRRFIGGPQGLALKMAGELGPRLVVGAPARTVRQSATGVEVETELGPFRARRACLAMMPTDSRRITFEPGLPQPRVALVRRWRGSASRKIQVIYEKPFWRAKGWNGQAAGALGPVAATFDNSPAGGEPGVLQVFCTRRPGAVPEDSRARKSAVLAALALVFGAEAEQPIGWLEKDWGADPWHSGCVSSLVPGTLTAGGAALREPAGRLHWAGTESSIRWNGYMEGAVRAGIRAAVEMKVALEKEKPK